MARWNTLACTAEVDDIKKSAADFIKVMRDDEGKYVQTVISNYNIPNFEGVISPMNSVAIEGVPFTGTEIVSVVTGLTAGATIVDSNTGRVIAGADRIIPPMTNSEIIDAINQGYIVFSANMNGDIKIDQDINTYRTFTPEKNKNFRKNRIIRTLDEIGTTLENTWETMYLGRVNNDENGRSLFRGDCISYFNSLMAIGAIQEFNADTDVVVRQGEDLDAVIAEYWIMPVDSMEKLYGTVNVKG